MAERRRPMRTDRLSDYERTQPLLPGKAFPYDRSNLGFAPAVVPAALGDVDIEEVLAGEDPGSALAETPSDESSKGQPHHYGMDEAGLQR